MGGYRGEKEEEALCVKGMRLGGRGLFTAAANFGLRNFYLDGSFVYECSPMICLVQVPRDRCLSQVGGNSNHFASKI